MLSLQVLACTSDTGKPKPSTITNGQISYNVDTLRIHADSKFANYFEIFSAYQYKHKPKMMVYDAYNHSLVDIDLANTEVTDIYKLELNGENGVSTIEGLYVHKSDSIFVYENGKVKILNRGLKVIAKYDVAAVPNGFGFLYTNYKFKLRYNPLHKCVLLNNSFRGNRGMAIKNPAVASLDIVTGKLELLPIMYSDYMIANDGIFGYQFGINFDCTSGDRVYYTFPVQSDVFVYDFTSGQVQEYQADSQYTTNEVEPLGNLGNRDAGRVNFIESPAFYGIMKDKMSGLHYRIHREGKPFNISEDEFNAITDVHFYITVLDQNMNYIVEIELPKNVYAQYTWFYLDGSLYLSATNNKYENLKEDVLELHKFTFKVNHT